MSICTNLDNIPEWVGLKTIIRVESQRTLVRGDYFVEQPVHTRYYLASFSDTVSGFANVFVHIGVWKTKFTRAVGK